jgi:uncharacterized repeat protein (TIGR01451 family)
LTPTFEFGSTLSYCIGAAPAALPAASTNGINGTWSPASISTSAAGTETYTFTPNAGECSNVETVELVVTVNAFPTGTLSYDASYFCWVETELLESPTLNVMPSGLPAGSYSATPSGLQINSGTGVITVNESTIHNYYTVTYTVPAFGGCASVDISTTVEIRNCMDLTLVKSANLAAVCYESDITFTIELTNNDPIMAATGISVVDTWPSSFTMTTLRKRGQ